MKRVCHITTVHPTFDSRVFYKEVKTLAKNGYDVSLIVQHEKNTIVDGVKIIALPKIENRFKRLFLLTTKAYKLALKQKAQVYHFHDPELLPWMAILRRKTKAKIIYDIHEDYASSIKQKNYIPWGVRNALSLLFSFMEKILSRNFTKILAEKYYAERFPEGKEVLNYPTLNNFNEESSFNIVLEKENRVIYTGNVSEDRGAFIHSNLVNLVPSLHVYMVGKCDKNLADRMRNIVSFNIGRIHIEGEGYFVPHEKVISYYNAGNWLAGLSIFPKTDHYYKKELTKFFEYMKVGIPIIASDFSVWKKLIQGNNCGICVNPKNLGEIAEAVKYLIKHPGKAKIMGENGKKAFLKKYNWGKESRKLLKIYEEITKK